MAGTLRLLVAPAGDATPTRQAHRARTLTGVCCLTRELPLATFNIKDYADFAEHEGLELIR